MTKTIDQIQSQIDKLQAEAAAIRKSELPEVIRKLKETIATYGITAKDLGLPASGAATRGKKAAGTAAKAKGTGGAGAAKFADGQGNTWIGRGKRPQWLRDALAQGKSLEDFLVAKPKRKRAAA